MFFFLKSPGSRCFDTAQLFVLIGFCVVEFKSNHSNTKASQKIMTLDFQFMDQKSQTWQAQTIMTSRFLQFKPQQNHQKSITKQQIPSWLIHWKIKPQNIHRFINLTYWKKNNECTSIKSVCFFFPWPAPKNLWENPTLSNFNPMLVVFPRILFSGLRNNHYKLGTTKKNINKQVPKGTSWFCPPTLWSPQACNKGSHDLGTNEWMDSERTDGSTVRKKKSKVGYRWFHGDRLGWLLLFWWVQCVGMES